MTADQPPQKRKKDNQHKSFLYGPIPGKGLFKETPTPLFQIYCKQFPARLNRGPKDHVNTRIPQTMISSILLLLGLGNKMSDPYVCVVFWAPTSGYPPSQTPAAASRHSPRSPRGRSCLNIRRLRVPTIPCSKGLLAEECLCMYVHARGPENNDYGSYTTKYSSACYRKRFRCRAT